MILLGKLKEVLYSVLPITFIVLIIHFFITQLEINLLIRFLIGAFCIIIGLAIFLFGVDIGITPIGKLMGNFIAKSNKLWVVAVAGLALGFFISVAEPDLHILAGEVSRVTANLIDKNLIVIVVSIGIAVLVAIGLIRVIKSIPINILFTIIYCFIFILAIFSSPEFISIAFDASGATTGALTVPFILALSLGISFLKAKKQSSEDESFGLVGLASSGAIIAVLIMSIISKPNKITGDVEPIRHYNSIIEPFIEQLPTVIFEVFLALIPLLIIFITFQFISFKLTKRNVVRILKGLLYTFIGLVLFLTGVNAGFMEVGSIVGYDITALDKQWLIIFIGFIFGMVTVLAEPAVYVLTNQIKDLTSGSIKPILIIIALSLGTGIAIALSMIRIIIPGVQLWHYLLPGYIIALILSYIVPKLFAGMAFDAGGVASGPMTATFILAFANGVAQATEGADVLVDGFGMIAMVALMPLITLQLLGLIYKIKLTKGGKAHE